MNWILSCQNITDFYICKCMQAKFNLSRDPFGTKTMFLWNNDICVSSMINVLRLIGKSLGVYNINLSIMSSPIRCSTNIGAPISKLDTACVPQINDVPIILIFCICNLIRMSNNMYGAHHLDSRIWYLLDFKCTKPNVVEATDITTLWSHYIDLTLTTLNPGYSDQVKLFLKIALPLALPWQDMIPFPR